MIETKLKPCPHCNDARLYQFTPHSTKHHFGYKVECKCGYALRESYWKATKEEAIEAWNKIVREVEEAQNG